MNKEYQDLKAFWDQAFKISDESLKSNDEKVEEDYLKLAPSQKLCNALEVFKDHQHVLDYGAGSGWASVIMSKLGTKKITAVDLSENAVKLIKYYAKIFSIESIDAFSIEDNWLKNEPQEKYDGFFSSNVLDVVPLEVAEEIIKYASIVTTKDADIVFSFNFYMSPEQMDSKKLEHDGNKLYVNGILRLVSLSDSEWETLFSRYFKAMKISYFAWPNEQEERRRVFFLKKK